MWRTHADMMPDEAAALTVLALADLHDAAEQAGVPWTLMLDEFGAVIKMAAPAGRSRSSSAAAPTADRSSWSPSRPPTSTRSPDNPVCSPSLTDNFAGVVAHRQTAPECRDWLAKLMGTRALWQSTNQTGGHGTPTSGRGSARRVREFRISSDTSPSLGRGEAVIYTPSGPTRSAQHPPRRTRGPRTRTDRDPRPAPLRAAASTPSTVCPRSWRRRATPHAWAMSTPGAPTCDRTESANADQGASRPSSARNVSDAMARSRA